MRKEIAERWVAALRSGEYEQSAGFLQTKEGYCCLGVLCDLHLRETGDGEWLPPEFAVGQWRLRYRDDRGVDGEHTPPLGVQEWADMEGDDYPTADSLANLNDHGYTFAQLADLIEEQWENL